MVHYLHNTTTQILYHNLGFTGIENVATDHDALARYIEFDYIIMCSVYLDNLHEVCD